MLQTRGQNDKHFFRTHTHTLSHTHLIKRLKSENNVDTSPSSTSMFLFNTGIHQHHTMSQQSFSQVDSWTQTQTHRHTDTQTHRYTDTYTQTHTHQFLTSGTSCAKKWSSSSSVRVHMRLAMSDPAEDPDTMRGSSPCWCSTRTTPRW